MDLYEAMENIRTDAGKGKKCPGGYSIPAGKTCRGTATGIVGSAAKRAGNLGKATKKTLLDPKNRVRASLAAAGLAAYALNDYRMNKKLKEVRGQAAKKEEWEGHFARRGKEMGADRGTKTAPGQSRQQPVDARAEKAKAEKDRGMSETLKNRANEILENARGRAADKKNEGWKKHFTEKEQARRNRGGTRAANARAEKVKAETDQDTEFMKEFNLGSDFTEKDLRRAKVAAARKYHPDVNPEGGQRMANMNAAADRLAKRARKDSFGDGMFFDLYPRWDSGTGSWSRSYGCY